MAYDNTDNNEKKKEKIKNIGPILSCAKKNMYSFLILKSQ